MIVINKNFSIDEDMLDLCFTYKNKTEYLRMTNTEIKIILCLFKRTKEKKLTTKSQLDFGVYGYERESNVVVKHIEKIRKKIGKRAEIHSLIDERHVLGYTLNIK